MKIINTAIELKNLYCIYNENQENEKIGLKNINFSFEKGKIYFIVGKSGCGKSTLLSFFNGLSYPQYGSVQIDDILLDSKNNLNNTIVGEYVGNINYFNKKTSNDQKWVFLITPNDVNKKILKTFLNTKKINAKYIYKIPANLFSIKNFKHKIFACSINKDLNLDIKKYENFEQVPREIIKNYTGGLFKNKKIKNFKELRRKVGVVYQFPEYQLFKSNILDEVMFGPINLGFTKEDAKENSISVLKHLSIPESYFSKSPFGLSGGQKRRVALSGILASNPEFLVFDEPTAGLDPKGEAEILKIILESKEKGKTVFVVTHSMEQVLEVADEVIVMDDGEIIKHGKPYEIFTNKDVINTASIILPNTINFINSLVDRDDKYKILYKMQPKNVYELADAIYKIKKGKKHV